MKRAWKTTWCGVASIVAAATRGKAIARTLSSAEEAGYYPKWKDIRAVRAPEHDDWSHRDALHTQRLRFC